MSRIRSKTGRRAVTYCCTALAVGSLLAIPAARASSDATCPSTPCIVADDLYASDQDNQAMDPGFERTPASQLPNSPAWSNSGTGNAWHIVADSLLTNVHSGSRSAQRTGNGTSTARTLLNDYRGEARQGEQFEIGGWVRSMGADASSTGGVVVTWYDRTGTELGQGVKLVATTSGAWTHVSTVATAPAGTVSASGGFQVKGQSTGTWYADDLVVRQRTELPGFGLKDTLGANGTTQSVDPSTVQKRVTGTCTGSGTTKSINAINADGTAACGTAPTGHVLTGSLGTLPLIINPNTDQLEAKMPLPAGTWQVTVTTNFETFHNQSLATTVYARYQCRATASNGEGSGYSRVIYNVGPGETGAGTLTMNLVATLSEAGSVGLFCSVPSVAGGTYKDVRFIAVPEVSQSAVTITTS